MGKKDKDPTADAGGKKAKADDAGQAAEPSAPEPAEARAPEEVEAEPFEPARDPGPTFDAPPPGTDPGAASERSLEDNLWPTLCHLSPLLGWVFAFSGFGTLLMPFLWIAAPLVVWQTQKANDPRVEEHGREAVNFQLNVVALSTILIVTCVLSPFGMLLPVAAIVLSLFAALQAAEGRLYRYPFIYRVIRD